jgi:hypothetical protein
MTDDTQAELIPPTPEQLAEANSAYNMVAQQLGFAIEMGRDLREAEIIETLETLAKEPTATASEVTAWQYAITKIHTPRE